MKKELSILVGSSILCTASATQKPNIVFLIVDQMTADAMSNAGNPYVKTPGLDLIAQHGVRFTKAYATQPLSSPSRTCMQTGRYPFETGVVMNGLPFKHKSVFLGNLMLKAGYQTAFFGKWHVPCPVSEAGYTVGGKIGIDLKTTEKAVDYIQHAPNKPYFLIASLYNPHDICQIARRQHLPQGDIPTAPEAMNMLPPLPDNFANPANEPSQIRVVQRSSKIHYPTASWDEKDWRQYLWGYYRLVEKADAQLKEIVEAIQANTKRETIVIFVSDHGEGVAAHHWNQKQILYEEAVHVPTIVASFNGDATAKNKTSDALVSMSLDVSATVLDYAQAKMPSSMHGLSLAKVAKDPTLKLNRKYAFVETVFAAGTKELGLRGKMVTTGRYKYCIYDRGERREQLFDLQTDPGEEQNLINDASYEQIKEELKKALQKHFNA